MKKLFLFAGALGIALTLNGQSFQSRQFLSPGILAIVLTNAQNATVMGGYTNIASWGYVTGTATRTNSEGLGWTNSSGTFVVVTNAAAALLTPPTGMAFAQNDSTALTIDVPLWCRRDGQVPFNTVSNSVDGPSLVSDMNLSIKMKGSSGSTGGNINLIFVPLYDGVNESTIAADAWAWPVLPTTTTTAVVSTNLPIWKWPGAQKIRLKSATYAITGAANTRVAITSLTLNGFVP